MPSWIRYTFHYVSINNTNLKMFEDLTTRNIRCQDKDEALFKILDRIQIRSPEKFTAILMPAVHGSGFHYLRQKGVPTSNLFAIERDPVFHAIQKNPVRPEHQHLKGLNTTPVPMEVDESIDSIYAEHESFDLVYLDFLGQPGLRQHKSLMKLFSLGMMKKQSHLILTVGTNRGGNYAPAVNRGLNQLPLRYIESALQQSRNSKKYRIIKRQMESYVSKGKVFLTGYVRLTAK